MNTTSLLEALDFTWNHNGDMLYHLQNSKLSVGEKICKRINDYIVYLFALVLGVDTFKKISDKRISVKTIEDYEKYVNRHSHISLQNQSVILILNGENDIPVSHQIFERLEQQSNCKIKFVKIEDLNNIKRELESLKKANNTIRALWIRAHGTPVSIDFAIGAEVQIAQATPFDQSVNEQQIENTRLYLTEQLKELALDAPIILESCFTGQERESGKENMAQFFASAAGGRKVYAPSREALSIDNISYTERGFNVKIKSFQSSTYFAKGSCLARMCVIWHAFRNHQVDITCEFKQ